MILSLEISYKVIDADKTFKTRNLISRVNSAFEVLVGASNVISLNNKEDKISYHIIGGRRYFRPIMRHRRMKSRTARSFD